MNTAVRLAFCVVLFSMIGCSFPPRHDTFGSTHVAVLSVTKFDDYKDTLQPAFDLTPQQALEKSVPNTMHLEQALVDAFSARVGLKLAPSSELPAGFGEDGDGAVATPSITQNVGDRAPKAVLDPTAIALDPHLSYLAATSLYQEVKLLNRYVQDAAIRQGYRAYIVRLQVTKMPRLRNQPYDTYVNIGFFQSDPAFPRSDEAESVSGVVKLLTEQNLFDESMEQLGAAPDPALRRYAQLADDIVKEYIDLRDARFVRDHKNEWARSAIERLERDVFDKAAADDTIGDIKNADEYLHSLHVKTVGRFKTILAHDAVPETPIVIPLLVTDQVEAALASRRADHLQQLALALSAAYAGIGGSVDIESVRSAMRASLGREFNSLFTVGRLSDNSLRVRIGARQASGLRGQSAQDGAYGDTSFEMLPQTHNVSLLVLVKEEYVRDTHADISMLSESEFVHVLTGKRVRPRTKLEHAYKNAGHRTNDAFSKLAEDFIAAISGQDSAQQGISRSDIEKLREFVWQNDREGFFAYLRNSHSLPDNKIDSFWFQLTSQIVGSEFGKATFTAMKYPAVKPTVNPQQTPIFYDDGSVTKVTVFEAKGINPDRLTAQWVLCDKSDKPDNPRYEFPMTAKRRPDSASLELTFPSIKKLGLTGAQYHHTLKLAVGGSSHPVKSKGMDPVELCATYHRTPSTMPSVAVKAAPSSLVATAPGESTSVVFVIEKPKTGDVTLTVSGAGRVKSLTAGGSVVSKKKGVLGVYENLKPGTEYLLTFESLVAGEKVKLNFAAKGSKAFPLELKIAAPPKK